MNIFILSDDPIQAAQYNCDKHVVKMVVELYQQMGSAVLRHGAKDEDMPLTAKGTPLKGGHKNHPCTKWVGDTKKNYEWAAHHALELCNQYTQRYNKIHSCQKGIEKLCQMIDMIPEGELTPFAQAMPEEYKDPNPVKAYRTYYIKDKKDFSKWKMGNTPEWFMNGLFYEKTNKETKIKKNIMKTKYNSIQDIYLYIKDMDYDSFLSFAKKESGNIYNHLEEILDIDSKKIEYIQFEKIQCSKKYSPRETKFYNVGNYDNDYMFYKQDSILYSELTERSRRIINSFEERVSGIYKKPKDLKREGLGKIRSMSYRLCNLFALKTPDIIIVNEVTELKDSIVDYVKNKNYADLDRKYITYYKQYMMNYKKNDKERLKIYKDLYTYNKICYEAKYPDFKA